MAIEEFNHKKERNSGLEMDFKRLQEAVEGRPEDGSDVPTLQASLEEVVKLRKLMNAFFKRVDKLYPKDEEGPEPTEILSSGGEEDPVPGYVRYVVYKG